MKNCTLYPVYAALQTDGPSEPMGLGDTPEDAIQDAYQHIADCSDDIVSLHDVEHDLHTVRMIAVLPDHDADYIGDDPVEYLRRYWESLYFADPIN